MKVNIKKGVYLLGGKTLEVKGVVMMDTGLHLSVLNDDGIEYLVSQDEVIMGFKFKMFKTSVHVFLPFQLMGVGIKTQKKCCLIFNG